MLVAVILLLSGALLVGAWRYLARETTKAPLNVKTVGPLEPGQNTSPVPRVALLFGARDAPLIGCISKALNATGHFRLIEQAKVVQLTRAEAIDLQAALSGKKAVELGQALAVEFVVFKVAEKSVAVADVLTSQRPIKAPLPQHSCDALVQEMVRVILGLGRVTAVKGKTVSIDIGWRSRVAPGAKLELVDDQGKVLGSLLVEKVELDRCTAAGKASVGQRVQIPR